MRYCVYFTVLVREGYTMLELIPEQLREKVSSCIVDPSTLKRSSKILGQGKEWKK